ncbi:tumor necrosis factor ligand superfamily member 6-like isoform X1 [Biomphalaria glabrata]|uniref:Tumor necrosis factor ligand superfamily member 6-like isoform X1 n=1 Tax=Biomphalaria glabrata TaxID=6526 RepID=A0A9W3BCU5_BIOGL|nr:tumor necrosis factor ligand superfamily member 6-like isoform X1 [Biomphalaria glabrata]
MSGKRSILQVHNDRLLDDYVSLTSSVAASDVEIQSTSPTRLYQKLVLVLAVVSILLCGMVLALASHTFFNRSESQDSLPSTSTPIACVVCKHLIKNLYDLSAADDLLDSLNHQYIDGVEKCCAYTSQQMSSLLELTMRRQDINQVPLPSFNSSDFTFNPVSAHKRMFPPPNPNPEVEYSKRVPIFPNHTVYVLFQHDNISPDPLVEHVRGVDVLKDGLRIVYSGLYFVYSSIHFRPESAHTCQDFKYQTWTHVVERMSPNSIAQSGCLLKTSHTCCDHCSMDEQTSYTGGVFYLESGDVLRVAISGYGLVYFRQHSSFAGLMMLGTRTSEKQLEE